MLKELSDFDFIYQKSGSAPEKLTSEQIERDVSVLYTMLTRVYSGWDNLKFSKQQELDNMLIDLSHFDGMSTSDFAAILNIILKEIGDNHLKLSCDGLQEKRFKNRSWFAKSYEVNKVKFLNIEIKSFSNKNFKTWKALSNFLYKNADDYACLILDLRNNSGGLISAILPTFFSLCGKSLISTSFNKFEEKTSPEKWLLTLSDYLSKSKSGCNGKVIDNILSNYLGSDEPDIPNKRFLADIIYLLLDLPPSTLKFKKYDNPVYILQNKFTASAAEISLEILKPNLKALSVGQNTMGCMHNVHPLLLTLPNSHLEINIPTTHISYKDGHNVENIGIEPDVKIPPEKDSLKVAIKHYLTKYNNIYEENELQNLSYNHIMSR